MEVVYVLIGVVFLILIWVLVSYNVLVKLKNHCHESWSGIDTELKRRYDLIPNLVEAVKGYARHEQDTLRKVIDARNRAVSSHGSPTSQARDENVLVGCVRQLFAVSENYPQLKANEHFLGLQKELANTEDRIQAARRFYNGNVRDLNTRIGAVPSNIIARLFDFTPEEFFEIEEVGIRQPVKVTL